MATWCPFGKEVRHGCNYEVDGLAFTSIAEALAVRNRSAGWSISLPEMKEICAACRKKRKIEI